MANAKLFSINWKDAGKGFIVAVMTALLAGVYQLINTGGEFSWVVMKPVVLGSLAAGLGYLIKNFFTNSEDQIAKEPKS